VFHGMKNTSGIDFKIFYRNAVMSHTATRFHPVAQGCASRYLGDTRPPIINPDGVVSSSGFNAPHRTQPRWGIMYRSRFFQGSRCAATLRSVTESRWDNEIGDDT
jgi:hypothetical protein